jgi:anti-anti-sigma factor
MMLPETPAAPAGACSQGVLMAVAAHVPFLPEERLTIDVRHGPDEVVLVVGGALDVASAPLLARALAGVLREGLHPHVVLDLEGLGFMGAAGLGCIFRARRRLVGRGGGLAVLRPSGPIRRLLELCDLGGLLC